MSFVTPYIKTLHTYLILNTIARLRLKSNFLVLYRLYHILRILIFTNDNSYEYANTPCVQNILCLWLNLHSV